MNFSKKLCGSLLVFSLAFISCKQDKEPDPVPVTTTTENTAPQPTAITTDNAAPAANPATAAPQTTAVGINPPHGQPGHRCEIPVGAPLDSKPNAPRTQQSAQPQNFMMANPQQNTAPAQNQGQKPSTNPAHGQPFHRCDIAVGAPLP